MRWTDALVENATRASRNAASKRTARAKAKHEATLKGLDGVVSSQILKDRLGLRHPHRVIRTMERLGMIRKVRRIPQHWLYEVIEKEHPTEAVEQGPLTAVCIQILKGDI